MKHFIYLLLLLNSNFAVAGGSTNLVLYDVLYSPLAMLCIAIFVFAYLLVMVEEFIHLPKSKPVLLASGILWLIVAYLASQQYNSELVNYAIKHNILEYAELALFLMVAMTYVNALEDRNVFNKLRSYLVEAKFSYKKLFWVTGILAFFISPIADNLTTSLIMCAVIMSVGKGNDRFIATGCVNIVVAANAGGAFSPFGDITTLMVWQKGLVSFAEFFYIFVPSVINFVVPAFFMQFAIPNGLPAPITDQVQLKLGAKRTILLFLMTIGTAISAHNFFHLPPVLGMMMGMSYLMLFSYYLKMQSTDRKNVIDVFAQLARSEWDTLLFFWGIILCVGALSTLGYLQLLSNVLYNDLGSIVSNPAHQATPANILVGILSAIIDNIPVMFAILTMMPDMSLGQWLLVTLTAGVGGSLLSIGSAAGVALMGQSKGKYTFFSHLKWSWAIMLGYIASIICHLLLNADKFYIPINATTH